MHHLTPRLTLLLKQKGSKLLFINHAQLAEAPIKKFRPDLTMEQKELLRHISPEGRAKCKEQKDKFLQHAEPFNILITSKQRYCKETAQYMLTAYPKPIDAFFSDSMFPKKSKYPILNTGIYETASLEEILKQNGQKEFEEYSDNTLEEILKIIDKKGGEASNVMVCASSICVASLTYRICEILNLKSNLDYLKTLKMNPVEFLVVGEDMKHIK